MPLPVRAALQWLVLLLAMMANGMLRVLVLQPRLGADGARRLASLSGVLLILALAGLLPRPRRVRDARATGLVWLLLTLAFELGFGRFSGASWQELFADYDLARGRLWPLVLVTTLFAPWCWARRRGTQQLR